MRTLWLPKLLKRATGGAIGTSGLAGGVDTSVLALASPFRSVVADMVKELETEGQVGAL